MINDNIKLNGLDTSLVSVSYLKWGKFESEVMKESEFDLVVGSDIIYSKEILKDLALTIKHYLKSHSKALIANNKIRYDKFAMLFE